MNYRFNLEQAKRIVYPILVLIIGFSLGYFVILPKISQIKDLRSEIAKKEEEESNLSTYLKYLENLARSPLEIQQAAVNYALPQDKDVAALIVTYEGLSKAADIEVDPLTIEPGIISDKKKTDQEDTLQEKEAAGEPREMEFKMSAKSGNLEAVKNLINQISETRRIIEIADINLVFEPDNKINFDASLVSFYLPDPNPKRDVKVNAVSYDDIIAKINAAKVYENEVLIPVAVGKTNLFSEEKNTASREANFVN